MSFLDIKNVKIRGVAACVPERLVDNMDYELLSIAEREKYIETTGIRYRHCADSDTCTSDLCAKAAEKLIEDLAWDKKEIEALIFVSQTPDYKLPSTACVLQERLGLSNTCLTFDISMACTAYLYGLSTLASIISASKIKKALLLVGNTQSKNVNYKDKSSYLLFGDAGTATALEYNDENYDQLFFNFETFGAVYNEVIIPDGGYRNPISETSFIEAEDEDGNIRTPQQLYMNGTTVFSTAIRHMPKNFKALCTHLDISNDDLDFFLVHQANKFLCEKVRKKIGISTEKTPYNISRFGNTSGSTIPLLMITELSDKLRQDELTLGMNAISAGISVASAIVKTKGNIICPELIYL